MERNPDDKSLCSDYFQAFRDCKEAFVSGIDDEYMISIDCSIPLLSLNSSKKTAVPGSLECTESSYTGRTQNVV